MDSKKILNLSIAFCLSILSLSVFIYSINGNKAYGQKPLGKKTIHAVGGVGSIYIVSYDETINEITILANKKTGY